jgi:hypothetical protein
MLFDHVTAADSARVARQRSAFTDAAAGGATS